MTPYDTITLSNKEVIDGCSAAQKVRDSMPAPKLERLLFARALAYFRNREDAEAFRDLDSLKSMRPLRFAETCLMADILRHLGRIDDAMNVCQSALDMSPREPMGYVELAATQAAAGDFKAAISSAEKAISLDSGCAGAWQLKGELLMQKSPKAAIEALDKSLQISPLASADPEAPYLSKGLCYLYLNEPNKALPCLLVARKLDPSSFAVARELALAHGDLGLSEIAAHYAMECIRLNPDDAVGFALAARYLGEKGSLDEAAKFAKQLPELSDPSFVLRAEANFSIGDYQKALGHYDTALAIDSDHFQALLGKASILAACPDERFRNGKEAIRLATNAYERKRTREWQKWEPAMVLAEAYAEAGDFKEAVRFAKMSLDLAGPGFGRRQRFLERLSLFEKGMPYRIRTVNRK